MKNLIIDGNNILYRTFHANNKSGEPDDVVIGMCIHSALLTMNKYYRKYKPDDIVITFDSYSWRKLFTADLSKCVTNKKYKGHRRENKTPKEERLFKMLDTHIDEFCELLQTKTSVLALRAEHLEGDDLMAAYVQMHRDEDNVVVSGDKDMIQLLRYDGVIVVNPADDAERTLGEWDDDVDLFMFEKCTRGEGKTGDNIQSSFPRFLKKKMPNTFSDPYERENFMNHKFTQLEEVSEGTYEDVEYTTGDLFAENVILMDLRKQPKQIKVRMVHAVNDGKDGRGKYNHMKFLRFCTVHELLHIVNKIEDFVPMLTVSR